MALYGSGSMVFDKRVNDGRLCGLKVLADRGLLDVKRFGNGALRAASRTVVIPHFDGLVENKALFFREQFKEVSAVQRLSAEFQFVTLAEQLRKTGSRRTKGFLRTPNRDGETGFGEVGWRDPPHVLKGGKDARKRALRDHFKQGCVGALFDDVENVERREAVLEHPLVIVFNPNQAPHVAVNR